MVKRHNLTLKMENINLKTRTNVLEYSLQIENHINTLLLGHLGIIEKNKTKNFGNKAGIPFQSKIDLLYDIEVLDSDEHSNLVLLMNFRNKFLHDIDSTSFTYILENIDSGIKNRFLKFLDITTNPVEKDYETACQNLFLHNMKVISKKYAERRESLTSRLKYLDSLYESYLSMSSLSSNFAEKIMLNVESSDLENPLTLSALEPIMNICLQFVDDYKIESEKIDKLQEMFNILPKRKMIL